jgi:hypothetical protein
LGTHPYSVFWNYVNPMPKGQEGGLHLEIQTGGMRILSFHQERQCGQATVHIGWRSG